MPIKGIHQPQIIQIDDSLRLSQYDGVFDFAYEWYQDLETVYLVDGIREAYTFEKLKRMYDYLDHQGELYFIEVMKEGRYKPVGDVTFWQEDMPIVIGDKNYRGKKIGRRVIDALVQRGRKLGYSKIYVNEIYDYNTASKRCFESAGFKAYEKTDKGKRYVLILGDKENA